ncbi:subtilisin-like protein [Atractiella rhizophila]|nr:subtilisin-like protein [Atractiella rhizophila]
MKPISIITSFLLSAHSLLALQSESSSSLIHHKLKRAPQDALVYHYRLIAWTIHRQAENGHQQVHPPQIVPFLSFWFKSRRRRKHRRGGGRTVVLSTDKSRAVVNAYSAVLDKPALLHLLNSQDVEYVEQDSEISLQSPVSLQAAVVDQGSSSNSRSAFGGVTFKAGDSRCTKGKGAGVDIYSLDSGVNIEHEVFAGRAVWGATFGEGLPDTDDYGHGTHTMGIAAGQNLYGLATEAKVIAVKILNKRGYTNLSTIISGVNWAVEAAQASKKPSILNMSIRWDPDSTLDAVIDEAIKSGVWVVASAGNSDEDASSQSPARVPAALTVGAVDDQNVKADFSNFGPLVDLFWYGVNITSSWAFEPDRYYTASGTSQAAPGITGILACALSDYAYPSVQSLIDELIKAAQPVVDVCLVFVGWDEDDGHFSFSRSRVVATFSVGCVSLCLGECFQATSLGTARNELHF